MTNNWQDADCDDVKKVADKALRETGGRPPLLKSCSDPYFLLDSSTLETI